MTALDMGRKRTAYRLDERIIDAMAKVSTASGHSRNAWLEHHLFTLFKTMGYIEKDEQPLGETRGGDRTGTNTKGAKND